MSTLTVERLQDQALVAAIKRKGAELGFHLVGVAPAHGSAYRDYFRQWIDSGQAGSMTWLGKRFEERTDPSAYLPAAASVICVAINYFVPLEPVPDAERGRHGRLARYALGDDYHEAMKPRLYDLADWFRELVPGAMTRCSVDTAPVMEKELAARAGVGWVGKNTCLISPSEGSWLLLGAVLTDYPLTPDEPATDHCGTCTRCLEACPTGALTGPYQLDARRCISYLTIEHEGPIDPALKPLMGDWLYGCDVCQDVCPHNRKASESDAPFARPRFPTGTLPIDDVLAWDEGEFRRRMRGSAIKHIKLPILQRSARIAAENAAGAAVGGGVASLTPE